MLVLDSKRKHAATNFFSPAAARLCSTIINCSDVVRLVQIQDAKLPPESVTEEDPGVYIHWDEAAVAEFVRVANITPGLPPHQPMLATGPGLMTPATFRNEVRFVRPPNVLRFQVGFPSAN